MILVLAFLCFTDVSKYGQLEEIKRFELGENRVLVDPHFMDFAPNGDLFVNDRNSHTVLHWHADGRFAGSIGIEGQGPGELEMPELVHATDRELWVWQRNGKMSIFSHDGTFKRSFNGSVPAVRRFAVVNDDLVLVVHQVRVTQPYMAFKLMNTQGEVVRTVNQVTNSFFLTSLQGDNKGTFKAYGPEADIFSDKRGTIWFGFPDDPHLYRMDHKGEVVEKKPWSLPTNKPGDQEIEDVMNLRLLLPGGRVGTLSMLPEIKFDFSYPKADYTSFLIRDGRFIALNIPISGTDVNKGYFIGSYQVAKFDDGTILGRGGFRLPEDSILIFNNGRALAFVINDEDEYEVIEVQPQIR